MNSPTASLPDQMQAEPVLGLSAFRRMQLMLGWWGGLLVAAGILHNIYFKEWGAWLQFVAWAVITLAGIVGSVLIAPSTLDSGMFAAWAGVSLVGLVATAILLFLLPINPPQDSRIWLSLVWHVLLAVGYALTAYYMDKRWWFLVGWELLAGLAILLVLGEPLAVPKRNPETPDSPEPYNYSYGMINPDLLLIQAQTAAFNFRRNLGLVFGLSSGLPLLIAALPFWKDTYERG